MEYNELNFLRVAVRGSVLKMCKNAQPSCWRRHRNTVMNWQCWFACGGGAALAWRAGHNYQLEGHWRRSTLPSTHAYTRDSCVPTITSRYGICINKYRDPHRPANLSIASAKNNSLAPWVPWPASSNLDELLAWSLRAKPLTKIQSKWRSLNTFVTMVNKDI